MATPSTRNARFTFAGHHRFRELDDPARTEPWLERAVSFNVSTGGTRMAAIDVDADLEQLMRRWHHTTEFATAAWAEYQALRDALPASDQRVALAHGRWRAAERERRELMRAIEHVEDVEAA